MLLLLYTDEEGELPRPGVPEEDRLSEQILKCVLVAPPTPCIMSASPTPTDL